MQTVSLEDYMAVLQARYECRDNALAMQIADWYLSYYKPAQEPHFIELSQPPEG